MTVSVVLSLAYNQLIKPKPILVMDYCFCCLVLLISVETKAVRLMLGKGGSKRLTAGMLSELSGHHCRISLLLQSICMNEDECFSRQSFLHLQSANSGRSQLMLVSFLHIFQVTILFWRPSLLAVTKPCLCFQDVLGIKKKKVSCKTGKFLKEHLHTPQEPANPVFRLKVVRKVI